MEAGDVSDLRRHPVQKRDQVSHWVDRVVAHTHCTGCLLDEDAQLVSLSDFEAGVRIDCRLKVDLGNKRRTGLGYMDMDNKVL